MVHLRNDGVDSVSLYRPASDPPSVVVNCGDTVDVSGDLAVDQPYADAVLIDNSGELRAWATSRWIVV